MNFSHLLWRPKTLASAVLIGTSFWALPSVYAAADVSTPPPGVGAVDYAALIRELTLTRNMGGGMTMAMWLPDDFWRAALRSSGRLSESGVNDYIAVVHPYTLVAVLEGERGIAAFHFTDSDALRNEVKLEDSNGNTYSPLPPDSIAEDVRNLIQIMRPVLSNMMGSMGQHLAFLVFPSTDKAGHHFADPTSDGSLTVHVRDLAMRYRLPLGSLLPPSLDPKSGESFPGSYHFNPYTGNKLVPQAREKQAASTSKPE